MLLKLKRNSFNSTHSASSISIQQYTFCDDLADKFEEAADGHVCGIVNFLQKLNCSKTCCLMA